MATMAQLNTRMDVDLKAAGDSVLDLYGIAPSEIIRSLWRTISCGDEAFKAIVTLFQKYAEMDKSAAMPAETAAQNFISEARSRQARFEQEVGLDPATYIQRTNAELDDLVYQDWLEEHPGLEVHRAG